METWTWRHRDIKRKTEARVILKIRLPFAHRVNGSLSLVRLLTKKQTEVIRLQMD
jgi:hypothetical protein